MSSHVTGRIEETNSRSVYLKLVAVSIIWGGTFIAGRYLGSENSAPLVSASIRFILASAVLAFYCIALRIPVRIPQKKQIVHLAVLGFFGIFLYNVCFFYGLTHTTASRASLVVTLNPAMIALAGFVLFREKLNIMQITGVFLCIAGAGSVIISRNGDALTGSLYGDVIILGCVVSWVIYSVFSRALSCSLGPLLTVSYSIWFGTVMLCMVTLCTEGSGVLASLPGASALQWASLLYLGVFGSALAYIWYYDAIRQIGATRSGAFIALNPVTAVLFGVALFGEILTPTVFVGGATAILGIYLCNKIKKRPSGLDHHGSRRRCDESQARPITGSCRDRAR